MTGKILSLLAVTFILFFSTNAQNIPDYVPKNGLVGWWPFNGNANDESGNGNNGTVNGATLTTDRFGGANKAYDFDGSDWIELNLMSSINNSNQLAVSVWVKSSGTNSNTNCSVGCAQYYFSRGYDGGNGFFINTAQGNNPYFACGVNGPFAGGQSVTDPNITTIPHTQWNHLLLNYDGANINFYINSKLVGTTPYTQSIGVENTTNAVFGRQFVPGYPYFTVGKIDDGAIWNRALTQQEITNLYNAQSPCIANITNNDTTICTGKSITLNASGSSNDASVTDIDGNAYPIVKIGSQMWTQKNLNVSRYRNGDIIPKVTDPTEWTNLKTGAWCWYNNDSASYAATYGKIYNFYAVKDPRGLAPNGWRVPSENDWQILSNFLGGDAVAGGKMKTTGTSVWFSPNTGATNESGFNGLPGGDRNLLSFFGGIGVAGNWWTSDYNNNSFPSNTYVYVRSLSNVNTNLQRSIYL
jgi:uncharacterized protein (TIGR02145 family)